MFVIVVRPFKGIVTHCPEAICPWCFWPPSLMFQVNTGILISVTRIISRIGGESYKVHRDTNAVKLVLWPKKNTQFPLKVQNVNVLLSGFVSRLTAKAVAVLLPILGISWIFGILAVNTHSLVFLYIFAVFNSLQVGPCVQEPLCAPSFSALCKEQCKTGTCWTFSGFLCLLVPLPPKLWGMPPW